MHYVPESSREFLPLDPSDQAGRTARGIHYRSAPLYLLTAVVGTLLLADVLAESTGLFPSAFGGYRWALLAAVVGGSRILYHTLDDLLSGRVGAGLALTIAFAAAVWLGESMTAGLVVFITLTGECLERYTIDQAQAAIRATFELAPPTARMLRDGKETFRPLAEVSPGDVVAVHPGERLPADGRVIEGSSSVDQSALTGESRPVEKTAGDEVFAGTLNQFGAITLTVERIGRDTLLGQVTDQVAQAARNKSRSERTADRLARLFLPVVLAVASLTFLSWGLVTGDWNSGWTPTLGVLVVACPCALVLATPTAVMAALAWLARAGIVVKGSDALERLANVDTFAFDKTGTLTRGELILGTVQTRNLRDEELGFPVEAELLLYLVAIAELHSEHPLARPFRDLAQARDWTLPPVSQFTASAGGGVCATVKAADLKAAWSQASDLPFPEFPAQSEDAGITLRVGNLRWLEQQGVTPPEAIDVLANSSEETGETALFLAVDQQLWGGVGLRDNVREESRAVLQELKHLGIAETVLLTGDREAAAKPVLRALGFLDRAYAELLPQDKARWIEERQRAGRRVAMVGDGLNDAPALAAADVGITLARRGSDLAAEAGDIVLMGPPLAPLPSLVRLSRALVRNVRQSILLFAFGLNGLGMLLCAVGVLSPVAAAVLHEVGSLAVMLNALRLLWFEHTADRWTGRVAQRASDAAEWLTSALSPSRWVYHFVDHWNVWLRLASASVAGWWFLSNVIFLTHDEQAVVTRFGKTHAHLAAGWHWRWPAPFERIYRERMDRVRTLAFGFRPEALPPDGQRPEVIDWTSPHEDTGERPLPEEAVLLTADEVPVELTAEVHYRLANLPEFTFGNAQPEATLRALASQNLRALAAKTSLDELLTLGRHRLERQCQRRLQERAAALSLGLEILAVHVLEVHPPASVVASYRDVANALEEKEQLINEAQSEALSTLLQAAGPRALVHLEEAAAIAAGLPRPEIHANLKDETWRQMTETVREPDGPRLVHLAGDAATILLTAQGEAIEHQESARGETARFLSLLPVFQSHPDLTATELYWTTLEAVLPTRPLTILDQKAVSRRHLLLTDPETTTFPPNGPLQQILPRVDEKRAGMTEPNSVHSND